MPFTIDSSDVRIDKNGNVRINKKKARELLDFIETLPQPPVTAEGEAAATGVQPVVKVML